MSIKIEDSWKHLLDEEFNKDYFIGKNKLISFRKNSQKKLVCIEMDERAIPRTGNNILFNNKIIGNIVVCYIRIFNCIY